MPNLDRQLGLIQTELGGDFATITSENVARTLKLVMDRHPELDDKMLDEVRARVVAVMRENMAFADRGAFHMMVVADLEDADVFTVECIPDDIDIPVTVLEKLARLNPFKDDRQRKVAAYIILNSTTERDVAVKCGLAHFTVDAAQLLMPLLHKLCAIDVSIYGRILMALEGFRIVKVLAETAPNFLERFCFTAGSAQPHMMRLEFEDQVGAADMEELYNAFVAEMLVVLKEYLTSQ